MFSTIANADEIILDDYKIDITNKYTVVDSDGTSSTKSGSSVTIYPNNGTEEYKSLSATNFPPYPTKIYSYWVITQTRGYNILSADKKVKFKLSNCYYNIGITLGDTSKYIEPIGIDCLLYYSDGTKEYINPSEWGYDTHTVNITLDFTPSKDVTKIEFILIGNNTLIGTSSKYTYFDNVGEYQTDNSYVITLETQSEESGLLGGIIEWVKNIFNKIGEMAETLKNLPVTIWNLISEGIKSLFVPSDEYLEEYTAQMSHLLMSKFGAVYEVVDILSNSWDRIQSNDESNTIDFPEVTIPLPGDNEFTFGGQQVQIVPDGFDWLATSLKTLVGIICTLLCINGLKIRYDEIMGGK